MTTEPENAVPRLELSGDPASMGEQHGESLRELIRELATVRLGYLHRRLGVDAEGVIRRAAESMAKSVRDRVPDVFAESQATARAADIEYWQLIVAGAVSDLVDSAGRQLARPTTQLDECTLVAVASSEGKTCLLGTWDTHADATRALVVCRRAPTRGPVTLGLTTAGWPLQQAVTSHSLALANANLVATRVSRGLPFIAALPRLAAAPTKAVAVQDAMQIRHASARFYAIADPSGFSALEVVPEGPSVEEQTLPCVHTNHFVFATDCEGRASALGTSEPRLEIARRLVPSLTHAASPIEALHELTSSGVVQTGHGDEDRTGAIFALDPGAQTLHFATEANGPVASLSI